MSLKSPREIYFSFFMFTADLLPRNKRNYTQILVGHMQKLKEMGYDGFDLHIAYRPASKFDYAKEVGDYRDLKCAFDQAGLGNMKFATNVGTTKDYDPTSPDPKRRNLALRYLKSRVDITKMLGGEGAIMSGPLLYPYGAFPKKPLWSDALQDWIQPRLRNADSVFTQLAEHAEKNKVKLALEAVKNWESPPPNMVSEVLDFVERLQSKPCGITIDTAQVLMESQGPQIFKENVDRAADRRLLNYVHISPPDRGDVDDSWIPWDLMLGKLEEPTSASTRRFQGPYLIEIFNAIPPFDALMRMSRRRFWRPGEDPERLDELSAYNVASQALDKLRRQIDRVRSASVSGDGPREWETPQRYEAALRPQTVASKVNLGIKPSPADFTEKLSGDDAQSSAHEEAESFPFIVRVDRYGGLYNAIRIHTFVASYTENNIANATHIIESANSLVVVDGQFLAPYARQFRAYAARLNKPIERVYLSHRHPDHWFGMPTAFADQTVYALQDTIQWVKENGKESLENHVKRLTDQLGEQEAKQLVPTTYQFKIKPLEPHKETIDGVKYVFEAEYDAEVEVQLTIKLPDLGVAIVQDLIYSGTHLYLSRSQSASRTASAKEASRAMVHWRQILQTLAESDYKTFLAGHGKPAGKNELHDTIEYLIAAQRAFASGRKEDDLQQYLLARYPARLCPGILPIYLPRLYGRAGEV
jgi:sugar phosphate isomerase/epimerase